MPKFNMPKVKAVKVAKNKNILGLPSIKDMTWHTTKVGDRTLTTAQRRKIKEEQGFKCARCGKKTPERLLEIHHKKSVASHKHPMGWDMPVYSQGKKIKPKSDRRSNLEAVCIYCHDKTKKKPKKKTHWLYG